MRKILFILIPLLFAIGCETKDINDISNQKSEVGGGNMVLSEESAVEEETLNYNDENYIEEKENSNAKLIYTYEVKTNGESVNVFSNIQNNSTSEIKEGQKVEFSFIKNNEVIKRIEGKIIEKVELSCVGSIDLILADLSKDDFDKIEINLKKDIN